MKKLLSILIFLMATNVFAQNPTSTVPLPPDIAAIKKKNALVVAMYKRDTPPFFSGTGQDIVGLDAEIARRIGDMLGVPVQFRKEAESFADAVEMVRSGAADIAVSKLSITGPRLMVVRFSVPYLKLKQAMIVNRLWISQNARGRETFEVIRDFNGRISFMRNSSYDTFARINWPRATFVPADDWNTVIKDVMSGKIAAGFRDEFEVKKIAFENPEAAISTKIVTLSDSVDNLAVAVNYQATHLLPMIDFIIRNEFGNLDNRKMMDRYKSSQPKK